MAKKKSTQKPLFSESPSERFSRYEAAKRRSLQWESLLFDAYRLTVPNRNTFFTQTRGEEKTLDVFDSTAVQGVNTLANNIQSILMPPLRRWANLKAGFEIPPEQQNVVNLELQKKNQIIFNAINQSNLAQIVNESLHDMAISTGVMMVLEGDDDHPLNFISVDPSTVSFEDGPGGRLENFWRRIHMSAREIHRHWPEANMNALTSGTSPISDDARFSLIEGTIFYPDNRKGAQYFYYVQNESNKEDVFWEFRDWSPWIGFRFNRFPGEMLGRGPVLTALPFIRVLNLMAEYELRANHFKTNPPWLAQTDSLFNPYNARVAPGNVIPVHATDKSPLVPLELPGDIRFTQLAVNEIRQRVADMLFADPLGPVGGPTQTATEISIRQENWVRRTGASFGRLTVELLAPLYDKIVRILTAKGIIEKTIIDGRQVQLEYSSPLATIQQKDDVQRFEQGMSILQPLLGPQGTALGINIEDLPEWIFDKLGIDLTLLRNPAAAQNMANEIRQQLQGGAQLQPETIPETALGPQTQVPGINL